MIIENARYKFVNISSFDSVEFGSNREQGTTYLKVFFIDGQSFLHRWTWKGQSCLCVYWQAPYQRRKIQDREIFGKCAEEIRQTTPRKLRGVYFLFIIASHENFLKRNIHIFIFIHCCMNHTIIKVLTDDRTIWANHLLYLFDR